MIFRVLLLLFFISINSYANVNQAKSNEITQEELLSLLPTDKFLGDIKAPVLMIEYASLTCYYCSLFHKNVFPEIKQKYIDTGKVLYIFRHFPFDHCALKSVMLSYCYPKQEDFFNFNNAVFDLIDSWNYSNLDDCGVLKSVALISNIKEELYYQCTSTKNNPIIDRIIFDKSLAINKLGVSGSPAFFIKPNDDKLYLRVSEYKHEGYKKFKYFSEIIDELHKKATDR
ncbi:thioredoxin domain-containing protein [Wolbachia endosymbiont of Chironomus riparius]|uniref:thioredoxin domain-containing protein n=1 Tax=Wolbachia endosymbiont of Chironomus riparius TaxID=2883238 RepID=UPI00209F347E|nr:thioredoxin domain-containing protein [Wolbachia endosymbiont of Chironomus riparius]